MTIRELKVIISTTNYASYTIYDRYNHVLCMPTSWAYVPKELKDAKIHKAVPRLLDTGRTSVIAWTITVDKW